MSRKHSVLIRVGVIGLVCFSGVLFILFYGGHLNGLLPGACFSLSLSSGFTLPRLIDPPPRLELEFRVNRTNPNFLFVTAVSRADVWNEELHANEYYAFQSRPLSRPYRIPKYIWDSGLQMEQIDADTPEMRDKIPLNENQDPIGFQWPGQNLTDPRPSVSKDRSRVAFISYTPVIAFFWTELTGFEYVSVFDLVSRKRLGTLTAWYQGGSPPYAYDSINWLPDNRIAISPYGVPSYFLVCDASHPF